jgi:hypothetical protein
MNFLPLWLADGVRHRRVPYIYGCQPLIKNMVMIFFIYLCVCVCVCGTGAWTQGFHFEPLCKPFLWWVFSRQSLMNYFPGLASNDDPSDLCLLSSLDHRCKPPVPC